MKNEASNCELRKELDELRVENDLIKNRNIAIEQRLYRLENQDATERNKKAPNIHELLGNIDSLAAKNLSSFGIKNRIGNSESTIAPFKASNPMINISKIPKDVQAKQMISSVNNSMGCRNGPLCNLQVKTESLHPTFQSPIQRQHQLVREGFGQVKENIDTSKSKSKVSMYSVTVSRPRTTPSYEEESKDIGSSHHGTSEYHRCRYQLHFSGQRLMATPDKSDVLDIQHFSPINENYELVANNSCFLSPESSFSLPKLV